MSGRKKLVRCAHENFTIEGFYTCLIKRIIVDDQVSKSVLLVLILLLIFFLKSISVVDSPELQELLLYLNYDITDDDIPHCSKLMQLIENFQKQYESM